MEEKEQAGIGFFEKYLSVWVALCIIVGIWVGDWAAEPIAYIRSLEVNQVNIPIALLIWLMIYPMMLQIDFAQLRQAGKNIKGLGLTLSVNWLIKPLSMALFAWLFFDYLFAAWMSPQQASAYVAGAILLGAAPCTAMVFVWSNLSKGDANYTLVQVAVNDLVLLVAFVPIVQFLLNLSNISIPYEVLFTSVLVFVVIPLIGGFLTNRLLIRKKGLQWYESVFLPKFKPLSIFALLLTLVLLFAYQGQRITESPLMIFLIAIPLTLQTYFIFFITWFAGKGLRLPYKICAPASMIGASNFFELAVAVAIVVFGPQSGATLATVVGVLIEVPVMLSLVWLAKKWQYN